MCGTRGARTTPIIFTVSARVCQRLEKLRHLASVRLTCMCTMIWTASEVVTMEPQDYLLMSFSFPEKDFPKCVV